MAHGVCNMHLKFKTYWWLIIGCGEIRLRPDLLYKSGKKQIWYSPNFFYVNCILHKYGRKDAFSVFD